MVDRTVATRTVAVRTLSRNPLAIGSLGSSPPLAASVERPESERPGALSSKAVRPVIGVATPASRALHSSAVASGTAPTGGMGVGGSGGSMASSSSSSSSNSGSSGRCSSTSSSRRRKTPAGVSSGGSAAAETTGQRGRPETAGVDTLVQVAKMFRLHDGWMVRAGSELQCGTQNPRRPAAAKKKTVNKATAAKGGRTVKEVFRLPASPIKCCPFWSTLLFSPFLLCLLPSVLSAEAHLARAGPGRFGEKDRRGDVEEKTRHCRTALTGERARPPARHRLSRDWSGGAQFRPAKPTRFLGACAAPVRPPTRPATD